MAARRFYTTRELRREVMAAGLRIRWRGERLVLPGGSVWENGSMDEIGRQVDELHTINKPIASICGATLLLARKGYLDSLKHTSNASDYIRNFAVNYQGAGNYLNEHAVTDKNLITANGIAPVEFARENIQEHTIIR